MSSWSSALQRPIAQAHAATAIDITLSCTPAVFSGTPNEKLMTRKCSSKLLWSNRDPPVFTQCELRMLDLYATVVSLLRKFGT